MKPYLTYIDIAEITGLGKSSCYEIIRTLRKESGWDKTEECRLMKRLVIPSVVFLEYFPSAKNFFEKCSKPLD